MQIIIPMSGTGQRFIAAGYKDPKPLIVVDGKTIIEHVVSLFPGESEFIFICNAEHLAATSMREILTRIAPHGQIVEIPGHKKGPVFAVSLINDLIRDDDEVIVNYCDFSKSWDYAGFLKDTRERHADGAIAAYKGFHPHMLGTTNYAFMRDKDRWMLEIQEKKPFTDNRMQEFASDGTYYFRQGKLVKKYFQELMEKDINTNGEFYISMVYNLLVQAGLKVSIYEIDQMLQWGTPRDLEEYQRWSTYFETGNRSPVTSYQSLLTTNLIPMAGRGQRFVQEGYADPKPLIKVSGKPMIVQAMDHLPSADKWILATLGEHQDNYPLAETIIKYYPTTQFVRIDQVTEGQACTCELALQNIDPDTPILIGACDNGMLWDMTKYHQLVNDPQVDAIAWSFRHHPSAEANPQMYGWLQVDDKNNVVEVSVKKPVSADPYNDHAIVGTFYFRKAAFFLDALNSLYRKKERVNNEYYVDSCIGESIRQGRRVKAFEVDSYICWGTPNDLRTYEYWERYFNTTNG